MPVPFKIILVLCLAIAVLAAGLAAFSGWQAGRIAERLPNRGERIDIGGGVMINSLLVPAGPDADLPPIVFIHGASGNLNDPAGAFLEALKGRATLLFVDRPGHGYSDRGNPPLADPAAQADAIAALMDKRGIAKAIIVGHSFGGSITIAFALGHPDKVAGLLFLSPATHPWPGGLDWYYDVAKLPVIGPLFCHTLATPAGLMRMDDGIRSVFAPNPVPAGYRDRAEIPLVLRPASFCNNARDVGGLLDWVTANQPRYHTVTAPTIIITGDRDEIVLEELHSKGLKRDLPSSELVWVHGLGHKSDYIARDLAIAAIGKLAGIPADLDAMRIALERQLSSGSP